jgi:hypothetical protein
MKTNAPNDLLAVTRLKIDLLISQYADRRKVDIVSNKVRGASLETMKKQPDKGLSAWGAEWDKLGKSVKRECGGLIAAVFMKAYLGGFKPVKK